MSIESPDRDCFDLSFQARYPIAEAGEVALEDYARVLARARAAFGLRASDDPGSVRGVHVCGLQATPTASLVTDLEDFARSLVSGAAGGGLGWS
ncbi:MAG TPA: hypothetical protein VFM88_19890 [Vicinamibacteria bacterium]|nr:hypothetical protein [Vicinamibacteria bacterium]